MNNLPRDNQFLTNFQSKYPSQSVADLNTVLSIVGLNPEAFISWDAVPKHLIYL